jgi:hypothetical protein
MVQNICDQYITYLIITPYELSNKKILFSPVPSTLIYSSIQVSVLSYFPCFRFYQCTQTIIVDSDQVFELSRKIRNRID